MPVPKYFYMAILSLDFWFEHKSYAKGKSYKSYAISIDKLEEYTGIDFFHNLPDNIENTVEANYKESDWSWN
nr:DNA/RNA non-specific endonuclease [Bacteroides faecalis]